MSFPLTKYGICPFGGNSIEGQANNCETPIRDTSVRGQTLKWYPRLGRYLCAQCIKRLDDDEKALRAAAKHREDEEWRSKAGFRTSV